MALADAGSFTSAAEDYVQSVVIPGSGHYCLEPSAARHPRSLPPLGGFDFAAAHHDVDAHHLLPLQVARYAGSQIRLGGTLLVTDCTAATAPQRASHSPRP